MRGIINGLFISIHAPHAGRDARCKSNTHRINISIHAPHAGRDDILCLFFLVATNISIHAPHAGRDSRGMDLKSRLEYFNPRAPCGARRINVKIVDELILFQSTRPMRGATDAALRRRYLHDISIHAPHAGRDSKSIQNYFTHFCDKRQFLDNFTQNAAFQSVLSLADRQKLLYLRCEPLRKFLRAFASHYKIIGSSGR